jgi:hypothetical protein
VIALKEITGGLFPAHTYLLDGDRLVAYQRSGTDQIQYFKSGIRGFSRTGRKFQEVLPSPFADPSPQAKDHRHRVQGSKGAVYWVDLQQASCTCPGFTFRGQCRHITEAQTADPALPA